MAEDSGMTMGYLMGQSDNKGGGNGGGGFGGMFGEGLWAIIILAMLGFGNFGNGGNRGGGGGNSGGVIGGGVMMAPWATQADLAAGFNNSAVLSSLNDLKLGQAGVQQTLCQGFNGVNTSMLQGFHGVDNAICNLGYQMKDCCCELGRGQDAINYNMASQFCNLGNTIQSLARDITDNANANYRGLMDFLVQDKISTLTAENQSLKFAASQANQNAFITANQEAQTAEIIRRLGRDCPVPAYVVPNPNCCYGNPLGVGNGWGRDGGCGCGC